MDPRMVRSILKPMWHKVKMEDSKTRIALAEALEALDKQIPKKPNRFFNGIESLKICGCGGDAYGYPSVFNYCPYCGQAIDWE